MKKKKPKYSKITFVDNKGRTMNLSGRMTLQELLKIGRVRIALAQKGDPLPDGWIKDAGL